MAPYVFINLVREIQTIYTMINFTGEKYRYETYFFYDLTLLWNMEDMISIFQVYGVFFSLEKAVPF
jgi:hypothetical protein